MLSKKKGIYLLLLILVIASVCLVSGCDSGKENGPTASNPTATPASDKTEGASTETPVNKTATPKPTQTPVPTIDEDASAPAADFFDLQFNTDGNAVNKVANGVAIAKRGSIDIIEDSEIGKNVAVFKGGSNYFRTDLADYYDEIAKGFAIETYVKFTALPDTGYLGLIDNCEAGGFGSELHKVDSETGNLKFLMHLDGAYNELNVNVSINKWYHIVMTWDETIMSLYLDGELVDEYDSEYAYFKFTSITDAQYLAIGACCAAPNGGQGFKGNMAICRFYFKGLNVSEVAKLNELARAS